MANPYWTEPLPPQYTWPTTSFSHLTNYAAGQSAAYGQLDGIQNPYSVAPIVATYANATQKAGFVNGALPADRDDYSVGSAVNSATRYFPAGRGGVGMVTSPLQNAAQSSATGANDWHTVGVLRHGQTVWIHDPSYTMNSQTRLPMVPGTSNVTRLLQSHGFGNVNQVQIQGFGSTNQDCMGRSAQWVDNVLGVPGATAPYSANTFVPGQVTPGWQVIQRS